ncbi:hypothetical protein CJU89_0802 [Yarrowia sp. B02]|nr:hypothetical protein CJU89_0802 [Yarrowia sp. B02]
MPFSDVTIMRHLTVDIVSSDPQSFNIDVNPNISVGELRNIITNHFNELFLFSRLGQIASISNHGRELPWAMLVAGLNQVDTVEVHLKRVWGAKEAQRGKAEEKAKAVVIAYDQPRSEPASGASSSPDLVRDSTSPGLLEKVKSLDVSEVPDSLASRIERLNRFKVRRVFSLGAPVLFIRDGPSSGQETPLGLFLDPAFDAKERGEIQRKRSRL